MEGRWIKASLALAADIQVNGYSPPLQEPFRNVATVFVVPSLKRSSPSSSGARTTTHPHDALDFVAT
jgi:hypothetical protein